MSGVDLDKVLSALSDGSGGIKENSDSLLGLASEVNKVLGEFEKSMKMLENMHVLPALVRGIGKKFEIDVDSPLHGSSSMEPATEYHKIVFERLNGMTENQIGEVLLNGSKAADNSKPDTD